LHCGIASGICTVGHLIVFVLEQVPEVTAVHICIQQAVITDFTLRQGLPGQHPTPYTAHVLSIPVLI
jgi:hypothetical protein